MRDVMRKFPVVLLLALPFLASPAHAVSLTLGCSGTVTTTEVPKDGVAGDPEKENVTDMSVVVDFDQRTVSGFWAEMDGLHERLPITTIDSNGVAFMASKKSAGGLEKSITGTVDRITGKVEAWETILWTNRSMTNNNWDLRCKPTKPLF
jgi:hypothetical protein